MKAATATAALLLCASLSMAQEGDTRGGLGGRVEGTNEIFGGCEGEIITEAPFFDLDGCAEQVFPTGSTRNDCNGNGIPDEYDTQPCNPGEEGEDPGVCAQNPCDPQCGGAVDPACNPEPNLNPGSGDPLANYLCVDDDDDGHCNECDADKPRTNEDGDEEYCEDDDANGECDDCVQTCWVRIIDKLWWVVLFKNVTARCDVINITLDPELGDVAESAWPFPAVSFAFDTCWTQSTFVNNARIATRGALVWALSVYLWLVWLRFFWGM